MSNSPKDSDKDNDPLSEVPDEFLGPRRTPPPRIRMFWRLLPVIAFVLYATTLRAPATVVSPLLDRMRDGLSLSEPSMGVLTSIPVLCFGLVTPLASVWIRKTGANSSGVHSLVLMMVGAALRSAGFVWSAYLGMVLIGVGICIGNLVAPMLIGREFQRRAPLMMGLYSSAVNVAQTGATALAVPLAMLVGWQGSTAFWGIATVLIALIVWIIVFPPRTATMRPALAKKAGRMLYNESVVTVGMPESTTKVVKSPLVWTMAFAFAGHTFAYFAFATWLPLTLKEMVGMNDQSAGLGTSVFHLLGVVGPILVPIALSALHWSNSRVMAIVCVSWLVMPIGFLFMPQLWLLWTIISGTAQGAFFSALMTVVIQRARTADENRQMTALIQTFGYCIATFSPIIVGWLHGRSGSWTSPFILIIVMLAATLVCGLIVTREPGAAKRVARQA